MLRLRIIYSNLLLHKAYVRCWCHGCCFLRTISTEKPHCVGTQLNVAVYCRVSGRTAPYRQTSSCAPASESQFHRSLRVIGYENSCLQGPADALCDFRFFLQENINCCPFGVSPPLSTAVSDIGHNKPNTIELPPLCLAAVSGRNQFLNTWVSD